MKIDDSYNVARKGLYLVELIKNSKEGDKLNLSISNINWCNYALTNKTE